MSTCINFIKALCCCGTTGEIEHASQFDLSSMSSLPVYMSRDTSSSERSGSQFSFHSADTPPPPVNPQLLSSRVPMPVSTDSHFEVATPLESEHRVSDEAVVPTVAGVVYLSPPLPLLTLRSLSAESPLDPTVLDERMPSSIATVVASVTTVTASMPSSVEPTSAPTILAERIASPTATVVASVTTVTTSIPSSVESPHRTDTKSRTTTTDVLAARADRRVSYEDLPISGVLSAESESLPRTAELADTETKSDEEESKIDDTHNTGTRHPISLQSVVHVAQSVARFQAISADKAMERDYLGKTQGVQIMDMVGSDSSTDSWRYKYQRVKSTP